MFEFNQNPLGQIQQTQQTLKTNSVQDLISQCRAIKNSINPNAMLQQLAKENPQIFNVMNTINRVYNGDGRAAFMADAKRKGMTDQQIQEFLEAIK